MLPSNRSIWQIAQEFRREQIRYERAAASEMVRVYGRIWTEIDRQIRDLAQRYYLADEPKASWLYQLDRLQTLRQQVEAQLRQFSGYANTAIQAQQWQALQAGRAHAGALLQAAAGGGVTAFNTLPSDALAYMVGFQQDGSPLLEVLNRYGSEASQAMADRLLQGLALGQGPGTVARLIRRDMGMALWEALRLARTETLRAYRAANMETYRANEDIVEGWYWLSARNTRTCAMCWAMDGTFHKLGDSLDDHPNGRCTAVPKLRGIDLPARLPGVEAFDKLRDVDQFRILGPSKYAAYRKGDFRLKELVGVKHDERWGRMYYERSLKALGINWREYAKLPSVLQAEFGEATAQLVELARKMLPEMERLTGNPTKWGGVVNAVTERGAAGIKYWTCEIGIDQAYLRMAIDSGDYHDVHAVLVHELFHSVSVSTPAQYIKARWLEEGPVEMMQRLHGARLLKAAGEKESTGNWAYNDYIQRLETYRAKTSLSVVDFYRELIRLPLDQRADWVYNQVRLTVNP